MGTTRQKNKKQKHGSDQKRNFCSNDENLCKWLGDRINLSNPLKGDLPEERGLRSRGEILGTQLTAPTSKHISKGHDYFTYLFFLKHPICQGLLYCLFVNFLAMPHSRQDLPRPGVEIVPLVLEVQSLNYWTAGKSLIRWFQNWLWLFDLAFSCFLRNNLPLVLPFHLPTYQHVSWVCETASVLDCGRK